MFNKVRVNQLLVVFTVLAIITVITVPGGKNRHDRSFKQDLLSYDTSMVTAMVIYPPAAGESVNFRKENNNWLVSDRSGEYNADNTIVINMLSTLNDLTVKRLAARDKEEWEAFEVTDSLATRVEVRSGNKVVADIFLGKFSYTQAPQAAGSPYMQQQGATITSYVRLDGEKEVYAVDGFLNMTFNRDLKTFRDSKVLKLDRNAIASINFRLPGEDYTLIKNEGAWLADGLVADSAAMADYLKSVVNLTSREYLDGVNLNGNPTHIVSFSTDAGLTLAEVDLYYVDSTQVALISSANSGTVFDAAAGDLFSRLVKKKADFLAATE